MSDLQEFDQQGANQYYALKAERDNLADLYRGEQAHYNELDRRYCNLNEERYKLAAQVEEWKAEVERVRKSYDLAVVEQNWHKLMNERDKLAEQLAKLKADYDSDREFKELQDWNIKLAGQVRELRECLQFSIPEQWELEHPAMRYVTVQIDKRDYAKIQRLLAVTEQAG